MPNCLRYFLAMQRVVRRGPVGRKHGGGRPPVLGLARIQRHRRMTASPPKMVVAKIGQGGEEPGREIGVRAEAGALLVKADKRLGREVAGVGMVLDVTKGKAEKRPLPARNEGVESGVIARLQGLKLGTIGRGVGRHGGAGTPAPGQKDGGAGGEGGTTGWTKS